MGSIAQFSANPLLMVAHSLMVDRRIVVGIRSIRDMDPIEVGDFPRELVITEQFPEWRVLVLALERLAAVVREVWGEKAVGVLANWLSQVSYIGIYDWDSADRDGVLGKVFDIRDNPVVHLGAFDERSIHQRDPETDRFNIDKMAAVILHELFHVAEPLHTGIDLIPLKREYSAYISIGQESGLSRLALAKGELIAWVGELFTFGFEAVDRRFWVSRYEKLVEWVNENKERLLVRFPGSTIFGLRKRIRLR